MTYLDPFGLEKKLINVMSKGISFNVGYWIVGGISLQMTSDSNGGMALQIGLSLGVGIPGASVTLDATGAKGYSYNDAAGWGFESGIGGGWGGFVAGFSGVSGTN